MGQIIKIENHDEIDEEPHETDTLDDKGALQNIIDEINEGTEITAVARADDDEQDETE